MISLGLSFNFHDASAAIVKDGKVVSAAAEERFSLQKHSSSFPENAISASLRQMEMSVSDVDSIIFYEKPHEKFLRVLHHHFHQYPWGIGQFSQSMRKWLGSSLWIRNTIASELGVSPTKIEYASHHQSHVAQAFGNSPFEQAAVLVMDAVGENSSTTLAMVNDHSNLQSIKEFESYDYPNSIGLIYAALTAFLGFKPNSGEASTMALAAYGKPHYVEQIHKILWSNQDGSYEIDASYFDFDAMDHQLYTSKLMALLGEPRDIRKPFSFGVESQENITGDDQRYADIAASLQVVLEEVILGLCRRLKTLSGSNNLCIAGGVALNCLANTAIIKSDIFDHVFIPSDPGDGGAATGAALLGSGQSVVVDKPSAYLGTGVEDVAIRAFLDESFLYNAFQETHPVNCPTINGFTIAEDLPEDVLIQETVNDLVKGKIVGWVQNRFEFGPRALGNRSLLVDPANAEAMKRLSQTVKNHVAFRPYALSIQAEAATRILECEYTEQPLLRWMQSIWPVKGEHFDKLRGGIHVDGTTRPQICAIEDNPLFWKLLSSFGEQRGLPALLNTSFNERGLPMVATATQALMTFMRTGIDTLVIDNCVIRKV